MLKEKKILFYIANYYVFRSGVIGYLQEIAKQHEVIFLSEKMDEETERVVRNKEFFPKLKEIIPVSQYGGEKANLFLKNRYLHKIAHRAIDDIRPDVIISESDTHSLLELYMMRMAKQRNILTIALQTANIEPSTDNAKRVDFINAYLRFPSFLPFFFRAFLVKCRKYFGHFLYYWLLPLLVLEKPFLGKSSHILRKGSSGMRDADYQIAFSERDRKIFIKEGVPEKKLRVLLHPLIKNKRFFKEAFLKRKENKKGQKTALLILPDRRVVGLRKKDFSLISLGDREKEWRNVVKLIHLILPGWKICLKPHPDNYKEIEQIKKNLDLFSFGIEVLDPRAPADRYIELSDIIIGLPISLSTVIFTASLQCPKKPIFSLDFFKEIGGDYYRDFKSVDYIDNKEDFAKKLELIKKRKYKKKSKAVAEPEEFSGINQLLESLLAGKQISQT